MTLVTYIPGITDKELVHLEVTIKASSVSFRQLVSAIEEKQAQIKMLEELMDEVDTKVASILMGT